MKHALLLTSKDNKRFSFTLDQSNRILEKTPTVIATRMMCETRRARVV